MTLSQVVQTWNVASQRERMSSKKAEFHSLPYYCQFILGFNGEGRSIGGSI